MALANTPHGFPAEHEEFFEEFQALIKKYPRSGGRLSLAAPGDSADRPVTPGEPRPTHGPIVWECEWFAGFPDCRPVILE